MVECGDPGEVRNSRRTLSGVTYASTVEYVCNSGFVLIGIKIRSCQRSGAWSGSAPSCQSEYVCQQEAGVSMGEE